MKIISLTLPIIQSKVKNRNSFNNLIKNIQKFYIYQKNITSKNDLNYINKFLEKLSLFFETYYLQITQFYYYFLSKGILFFLFDDKIYSFILNEIYFLINQYNSRIFINDVKNSIKQIKEFIKKYNIETCNFQQNLKELRRLMATSKEENIQKILKSAFDFLKMIINR